MLRRRATCQDRIGMRSGTFHETRDHRGHRGPRNHGGTGPWVFVLHGGPGAPGSAAPMARGLADAFRVLEPFQRPSGDTPLTVDRHVEDLRALLDHRCGIERPALVGHSWGAMLALAFAAAHPVRVRACVLVGCGTFDAASRARLEATVASRTDAVTAERIARLATTCPDPDARLHAVAEALLGVYSFAATTTRLEAERCDARACRESWDDMLRLQREGAFPAAFSRISAPVLMIHGDHDPHPGEMIRQSLTPHIPQLAYRELARCGHYPWLEREAREEFFRTLRDWLRAIPGKRE